MLFCKNNMDISDLIQHSSAEKEETSQSEISSHNNPVQGMRVPQVLASHELDLTQPKHV